jgi:hypothetical protein
MERAVVLPTRLLDVGVGACDDPRLVLSSEICANVKAKYAALSYCWGSKEDAKKQLRTEEASLERRREGIPCETMPSAIEDAVTLTRTVGLRYLWVDALCIVQDDMADWSRESGRMDSIYHHAFVTFYALNSVSCHETLLKRAPSVRVPFQSTIQPMANGYFLLRLRPKFQDWSFRDPWSIDITTSKWGRRGWTYQEELLSTRLPSFGHLQMHFQCGVLLWSEGYNEPKIIYESGVALHDQIATIRRGESSTERLYDYWVSTITYYLPRLVTYDRDRLHAISGLGSGRGRNTGRPVSGRALEGGPASWARLDK